MATVNRQCEVQVVCIYGVDAPIVLGGDCIIGSLHHCLNVGGTITAISHVDRNFGSVHSGKPSSPVALCSVVNAGGISIAQAKVIGSDHCVVFTGTLTENYKEIVPVPCQVTVISKRNTLCLT